MSKSTYEQEFKYDWDEFGKYLYILSEMKMKYTNIDNMKFLFTKYGFMYLILS